MASTLDASSSTPWHGGTGCWTKRDLGHLGTAARVLTGMAAVGTVPAFAPSIVLSIPRAPSWRWRRTRALRHSTRWRMCLLLSPRIRPESTSFSRPRFPIQTGSATDFQARASSSSATSCSLRMRWSSSQCGIDQQLELDLRCCGRCQSICAAQPGTFRARYSPPSTAACGPLTSTPTPSAHAKRRWTKERST